MPTEAKPRPASRPRLAPRRPALSPEQKEVLALELANDIPLSRIARTHGYTSAAALTRVINDPDIVALTKEKKKLIEMSNQLVLSKLAMAAPNITDNIVATAMDPTHPKFLQAATWVVDKRLPNIHRVEGDVVHHIDAELSAQVLVGLDTIRSLRGDAPPVDITEDPHLRDGQEAMAERQKVSSGTE